MQIGQQQFQVTHHPIALELYYCRSKIVTNGALLHTPHEQRAPQNSVIEALGITWASERFADYLIGLKFHIETDHKPLVSLLGSKSLEDLPARIQRFRMRTMRFTYTISHVPGKDLCTADVLSRAPIVRPLKPMLTQL